MVLVLVVVVVVVVVSKEQRLMMAVVVVVVMGGWDNNGLAFRSQRAFGCERFSLFPLVPRGQATNDAREGRIEREVAGHTW